MTKTFSSLFLGLIAATTYSSAADNHFDGRNVSNQVIVSERDAPHKSQQKVAVKTSPPAEKKYIATQAFTGKVVGNGVRMRLSADVESPIIQELSKDDLVVVIGERSDFYAVEPSSNLKAYVFRSFILDNIVEGNRVNVRLMPDLNAPVIGHLCTGDRIEGVISDKNTKWLEIAPPENTAFYIAKEFIDKVGGPDLKRTYDRKKSNLAQLIETAQGLSQSEMRKPYEEVDFEKIAHTYQTIINDYSEFKEQAEKAKSTLLELQEAFLQKKLAYLEARAAQIGKKIQYSGQEHSLIAEEPIASAPERMRMWQPVEDALFQTWSASHYAKNINDYYEDQHLKSTFITGHLEAYNDPIKHKPGDYIIRQKDLPQAYLYSTMVNLNDLVGKYVTLRVSSRPNNHFAFPAYFVLGVE